MSTSHEPTNEMAPEFVNGNRALFTMAMRLRKCRRCGHYPCPCCETWCDCFFLPEDDPLRISKNLTLKDATFVAEEGECPCTEDHTCVWTARDLDHNRTIFADMYKICETYGIDPDGFGSVEDLWGDHIVVYGKVLEPKPIDVDEKVAQQAVAGAIAGVVAGVRQWTDDDRLCLMAELRYAFCDGCGREQLPDAPSCQCQNDE